MSNVKSDLVFINLIRALRIFPLGDTPVDERISLSPIRNKTSNKENDDEEDEE